MSRLPQPVGQAATRVAVAGAAWAGTAAAPSVTVMRAAAAQTVFVRTMVSPQRVRVSDNQCDCPAAAMVALSPGFPPET
ncbi:hypothetical protein ALMP_83510 [Streptomyces sp. A012304]|nr:hypothetical protein ALMP_83510 [Streptomyces sp. A012304]